MHQSCAIDNRTPPKNESSRVTNQTFRREALQAYRSTEKSCKTTTQPSPRQSRWIAAPPLVSRKTRMKKCWRTKEDTLYFQSYLHLKLRIPLLRACRACGTSNNCTPYRRKSPNVQCVVGNAHWVIEESQGFVRCVWCAMQCMPLRMLETRSLKAFTKRGLGGFICVLGWAMLHHKWEQPLRPDATTTSRLFVISRPIECHMWLECYAPDLNFFAWICHPTVLRKRNLQGVASAISPLQKPAAMGPRHKACLVGFPKQRIGMGMHKNKFAQGGQCEE